MPLRLIMLLLLLPFAARSKGIYHYEYSENCNKAYQYYLSLHVEEAHKYLVNEIRTDPYNLMATYIGDYEDCILLLLNCSRADYDQRSAHLDERLELLDKGDEASPWYRLCRGAVYLHWAIINLRFGDQYAAAMKFRKSFNLLKENRKLFPSFEFNAPFAGLQEAVLGALPGSYKWIASIFGMKGNVKQGAALVDAFVAGYNAKDPLFSETVLYWLYIRFYLLSEQQQVWNYLTGPQFPTSGNLLNVFVKANLALDFRKSDAALEVLQAAASDPGYTKYPILDYETGIGLYTRTDMGCIRCFQRYLANNGSDMFIKDSWQKMALTWYLAGDMDRANACRIQIVKQGSARLDADKQALKFAGSNTWPSKKLLQARLAIDGGYNATALAVLHSIDTTSLAGPADKAEYFFRYGRVYEETDSASKALQYYQLAINTGRGRHEQFAARAALQMGRIYERAAMNKEATARYNECLDMPAHDFQNSIDQQAKAGLNRLGGKDRE